MSRIFYGIFALSVICNIGQYFLSNLKSDVNIRRTLTETTKSTSLEKAGIVIPEGARKIFIDLGANDGESTSYFLKKPEGSHTDSVATQGGSADSYIRGLGSSGDWEIVVFEANTNFTRQLNTLKHKVMESKMAKKFTVHAGTAIAKSSGTISFIIDNPFAGSAGATTMPESTSAVGPHFEIPAIGITDLFHSMKIKHEDFVVLKMDIEGAEFDLMRHIITHGIHTRIDIAAVEYHDVNYFVFGKTTDIREKYQARHKCLDWMVEEMHNMHMIAWG